ncbi:SIN3-HDAC complex-associated factor isoform X2 [Coccinella septempunctata]|uniref:SIN3-HDAC complex-associated factor isoform X2 n=1 Tax=Coccinella septempunctata TaxID=41139 RepID=UPI001D06F4BF|nr:SIN3-HDAC complex-associated factor isoform X2 [Coccinella septempunctata]
MFSFHRPKVYRSTTGCCICKAKSSSSRFTDSKKYEDDFLECFKLSTPRQGEICNACVLLVKRWKKLPEGTERNWRHVVDARAGPGMKSMTKFKSKVKKAMENNIAAKIKKKKHRYEREYSPTLSDKSDDAEMAEVDFLEEDGGSGGSSRTNSPGGSDCEENNNSQEGKNRRHKAQAKKREGLSDISDFIDFSYWTREVICCGTIYRGRCGEILSDPRFLRPCKAMLKSIQHKIEKIDNHDSPTSIVAPSKAFSDNSSDSGYDESSNPGMNPKNQKTGLNSKQVSIEQLNRPIANYNN